MPTYQYACTECGHRFEEVQAFTDDSLTVCPVCSGQLRKVYGSVGVVFKGSGFYRTDSRAGALSSAPANGSADKAAGDGAGEKKAEKPGGEKKAAAADSGSKPSGSASTSSPGGSSAGSSGSSGGSKAAAG